ncbi:RNA-binding domain-containing protein [Saitoella complicata NRRL Y-17804]|nr:RNA-binding domain-containing protein [Saitoella complicata NRRL Y-17804]ODQ54004.1 RNA-binding domain-containing protein [Saitoella complicata NRRL Y-17804]
MSSSPSPTLYIKNLDNHVKKDDLRLCLYCLFSTYGPILDVVALKTKKMHGQAHIVFRDVLSATTAMRALQGQEFLGKELRIDYARSKSDATAKLDGTYKMPQVIAVQAQEGDVSAPHGVKRPRDDDEEGEADMEE